MTTKTKKHFVRTPYNYDTREAGRAAALYCNDPSLTDQTFKDEVDINTIVEQFNLNGTLPTVLNLPKYGDFTGIFDFQSAMNAITTAQEGFMQLPAKLRARFNNDPQRILEFLDDPNNREEAEKLGLLEPKPAEKETKVSTDTVASSHNTVSEGSKTKEKGKESKT